MKAVIQRVQKASVHVEGSEISRIEKGILTLLGVEDGDTEKDVEWTIKKIAQLRIFPDADGKMNLSLLDIKGEHLLVSQFTLLGDTKKGNRPGFSQAAKPDQARALYEKALTLSASMTTTKPGQFQADMKIELVNDGPVTFILDSRSSARD